MKILEQKSKMTVSMRAIVGEALARVHKFREVSADHDCRSAGISVAGVLALNLSRRDRNHADLSSDK